MYRTPLIPSTIRHLKSLQPVGWPTRLPLLSMQRNQNRMGRKPAHPTRSARNDNPQDAMNHTGYVQGAMKKLQ
jgi:hypothetical protein